MQLLKISMCAATISFFIFGNVNLNLHAEDFGTLSGIDKQTIPGSLSGEHSPSAFPVPWFVPSFADTYQKECRGDDIKTRKKLLQIAIKLKVQAEIDDQQPCSGQMLSIASHILDKVNAK